MGLPDFRYQAVRQKHFIAFFDIKQLYKTQEHFLTARLYEESWANTH
jgi:hypothetical protein